MIMTLKSCTKLFRQPNKVGDVIESNGGTYLVLGIERYELYGDQITIWYTIQDLKQKDYVSPYKPYTAVLQEQFVYEDKYNSEKFKKIQLGEIHFYKNEYYKILEFTGIKFNGTDMEISFLARPVYPLDQKQAKAKLLNERRKKLKLEVF
ncbi:hypothetical protein MH117_04930 [Paenibacillus sp. ACRRX]|uniref:hypothetical protein n=1 Tax=Paenibacillus sp. ACRRX TaxID=2918206 RepID=UPI001EF40862|nr:hypothetical protein [Paenibacillus sp. ACRRX]MCG7406754.1 hypothetical protein [Paenibacillus sp. ACRRX]